MKSIIIMFLAFVVFDLSRTEESECTGPNCEQIISMPLLDNMEATLKADLDVRKLNKFLQSFIRQVVKKEVADAMHEDIKKIMNESVSNMESLLDDRTNEMKLGLDSKFDELMKKKEMQDDENKVALTAHLTTGPASHVIMKFDKVIFSVGYNNLSAYKSTGKFICERSGLYLISASILTRANNGYYSLYLNNNVITYTYISYNNNNPSSMSNTGTIVLALQLHPNDSVWLKNTGGTLISTEKSGIRMKENNLKKSYIHKVVKKEIENRTNEMKLDLDSKFDELMTKTEIHNEESMVLLSTKGKSGPVVAG